MIEKGKFGIYRFQNHCRAGYIYYFKAVFMYFGRNNNLAMGIETHHPSSSNTSDWGIVFHPYTDSLELKKIFEREFTAEEKCVILEFCIKNDINF